MWHEWHEQKQADMPAPANHSERLQTKLVALGATHGLSRCAVPAATWWAQQEAAACCTHCGTWAVRMPCTITDVTLEPLAIYSRPAQTGVEGTLANSLSGGPDCLQ